MKPSATHLTAIFIAIALLLPACRGQMEMQLTGVWAMTSYVHNKQELKTQFLANMLLLKADDTFISPISDHAKRDDIGKWELRKEGADHYLILKSTTPAFHGEFLVRYKDGKGRQVTTLVLENATTRILLDKII